ncbi:MAG: dihydrolipoamide succinyltransferase [Candidatus Rokuibacteriota bacterium]|nr:MAG: dihydrolipoamide succinyltransferase [Candidatus Rokubacteria bacterium]
MVDIEVRIPSLGESVTEAVIARWLKQDGEPVSVDEPILEIETEKAAMEIAAESAGRLRIVKQAGDHVQPGTVVARIVADAPVSAPPPTAAPRAAVSAPPAREPQPIADPTPTLRSVSTPRPPQPGARSHDEEAAAPAASAGVASAREVARAPVDDGADVERVPMTGLRRTIATRLSEARRGAAILTTFNEIDLGALIALRKRYRERFREKHGVDLGLVSLFARAAIGALHDVPIVNARIDGGDIVYHRRVHLGIAVATSRGLVVPVVRNADGRSLADLERAIADVAQRAREAKLAPDDLAGGTFTITNGGVFGSLLSTPLLNPPQSGILGMHKIQDRPVAIDGQVVIRPMMYVALSYDHRLVDGEQAVTFLVRVKEQLEDPARILLDV